VELLDSRGLRSTETYSTPRVQRGSSTGESAAAEHDYALVGYLLTRVMGTPILFSPENVRNVLVKLPSVAALLPDPALEGEPSDAFPGVLRKTQREVYRWIANTHYEHLADAVLHLERVHAAGCTFGSLLSTRDREQFVSLTAEVLVADDFLRRGYEVQTVQRSDQVSPDLLVVVDGLDVAVEVYSPRELLAVDAWVK
jgi:hypothetical protein